MSIIIKARDARLSIIGYQPEVKSIYWSHLPTNPPSYGQPLDLTGSEITAVYVDGEEAVVTNYCTFSPAQGAEVPNEPTMTVTATYTARSGKIIKADALLPIAIPSFLRIVVPLDVQAAKESGFYTTYDSAPTGIDWKEWYGWQEVKAYVFWERMGEIVQITEANATYSLAPEAFFVSASSDYGAYKLRHSVNEQTYDRYYTPTLKREETCNAVKIIANCTVSGIDLQAETYLEVDYIDHLELINLPQTCPISDYDQVTLDIGNIRTVFLSDDHIDGFKLPYQYWYPEYNPNYNWGADTQTIALGGQNTGAVYIMHLSEPTSQKWVYRYACSNGRVTWTAPDDE